MEQFNCNLGNEVIFGIGTLNRLGKIVKKYGNKALLAIDPYLVDNGVCDDIVSDLKRDGIEAVTFHNIHPNPICFEVDKGAAIAREEKCEVCIGVGGGSTLDTAKAIAVLSKNPGKSWDYAEGKMSPPKEALPIITIPTTSGTGSEVTLWSVVTNPDLKDKRDMAYDVMFPTISLVDPELMVSMPPGVTASTGVDALSHSLESFISSYATPYSKLIAKESIKLVARYLPEAVANGKNIIARSKMAWASTLGGMAIIHARTVVPHALGTAASALFDVPHGASIAACLANVLQRSFMGNFEIFAELAETLDDSVRDLPLHDKAEKCGELIGRLFKDMNYEIGYREFGIQENDIDALTEWLINSGFWNDFKTHPKLFTVEEVKDIYRKCL
jgi:alcohol dehydrogenase class IV